MERVCVVSWTNPPLSGPVAFLDFLSDFCVFRLSCFGKALVLFLRLLRCSLLITIVELAETKGQTDSPQSPCSSCFHSAVAG